MLYAALDACMRVEPKWYGRHCSVGGWGGEEGRGRKGGVVDVCLNSSISRKSRLSVNKIQLMIADSRELAADVFGHIIT